MNNLIRIRQLVAFCALIALPALLSADIVSAPLGSGTAANLNLSGGSGSFSWNITQSGNNYTYVYTFYGQPVTTGDTFEIIQQLNPIITSANAGTYLPGFLGSLPYTFIGNINAVTPNQYGTNYVLNANSNGTATYTFTSPLAPIWGSIDIAGANNMNQIIFSAVTPQFYKGQLPSASDSLAFLEANYIPTIGVELPEPHTWLLLTGLILFSAFCNAKKAKSPS
jgi:hypothetical protein